MEFSCNSFPFINGEVKVKQEVDVMDSSSASVIVEVNPDEDGIRVLDSLETADSSFVVLDPSIEVKTELENNSEKILLPSSHKSPDPLHPSEVASMAPNHYAAAYHSGEHFLSYEASAPKRQCFWNFKRIITRLGTHQNSVAFAEHRLMVPKYRMCHKHKKPMRIKANAGKFGTFICAKRSCYHFKRTTYSRAKGTFFEDMKIPLPLVFQVMYCYAQKLTLKQTRRECSGDERDEDLSVTTIVDWFSRCRQAVVQTYLETIEIREQSVQPTELDADEIVNQIADEEGIDEKEWRKLRSLINTKNYSDHIIEYSWRQYIQKNNLDPFEELIKAINHVYVIKNIKF